MATHQPQAQPVRKHHRPESLDLPSVPRTEVTVQLAGAVFINSPESKSLDLLAALAKPRAGLAEPQPTQPGLSHFSSNEAIGPSVPPSQSSSLVRSNSDADVASAADADSILSLDENSQPTTVVSMDDPDVRIAAEALSGLGNSGI